MGDLVGSIFAELSSAAPTPGQPAAADPAAPAPAAAAEPAAGPAPQEPAAAPPAPAPEGAGAAAAAGAGEPRRRSPSPSASSSSSWHQPDEPSEGDSGSSSSSDGADSDSGSSKSSDESEQASSSSDDRVGVDPVRFDYRGDHDKRGLIYYLACRGKGKKYRNPKGTGRVGVAASSMRKGKLRMVVDPKPTDQNFCTDDDAGQPLGSWIMIDLKHWVLAPNHYTMANRCDKARDVPHSWVLEGSVNKRLWVVLRAHKDDLTLQHARDSERKAASWSLPQSKYYFRYFRLRLAAQGNSSRTNVFAANCIEFYGVARRIRPADSPPDGIPARLEPELLRQLGFALEAQQAAAARRTSDEDWERVLQGKFSIGDHKAEIERRRKEKEALKEAQRIEAEKEKERKEKGKEERREKERQRRREGDRRRRGQSGSSSDDSRHRRARRARSRSRSRSRGRRGDGKAPVLGGFPFVPPGYWPAPPIRPPIARDRDRRREDRRRRSRSADDKNADRRRRRASERSSSSSAQSAPGGGLPVGGPAHAAAPASAEAANMARVLEGLTSPGQAKQRQKRKRKYADEDSDDAVAEVMGSPAVSSAPDSPAKAAPSQPPPKGRRRPPPPPPPPPPRHPERGDPDSEGGEEDADADQGEGAEAEAAPPRRRRRVPEGPAPAGAKPKHKEVTVRKISVIKRVRVPRHPGADRKEKKAKRHHPAPAAAGGEGGAGEQHPDSERRRRRRRSPVQAITDEAVPSSKRRRRVVSARPRRSPAPERPDMTSEDERVGDSESASGG